MKTQDVILRFLVMTIAYLGEGEVEDGDRISFRTFAA
jgi:hypothetical protein